MVLSVYAEMDEMCGQSGYSSHVALVGYAVVDLEGVGVYHGVTIFKISSSNAEDAWSMVVRGRVLFIFSILISVNQLLLVSSLL